MASTRSRRAKVAHLAELLAATAPEEAPIAVAYLSGVLPQGSIGVGWASLRGLPGPAPPPPVLALAEVNHTLDVVKAGTGAGSRAVRREALSSLFARATDAEQHFLMRLLGGELRQGALEGIMTEAVARAAGAPPAAVRRAFMLEGDLGAVARAALEGGERALETFRLRLGRPVGPMLAQTAADLADALRRIPVAVVEPKLDGARIQVHKSGSEARAFTRNLADVSDRVPEILEAVSRVRARDAILDGEAIAIRRDGRPHPFQVTMSRFGTRLEVDAQRGSTPLSAYFFDLLHVDGEDLIDRPAVERLERLDEVVDPAQAVTRTRVDGLAAAERLLDETIDRGHEGVMVKSPEAPYAAGRRGASWLKVKRAHTLDLVVLAAEWGHGRRRGWLSNLHLGARDPSGGDFVMLGKTFKGLTDEMLQWQTDRLLELETRRSGITVYVRPELVAEIAFDGLQKSSRYPGGVALRFARVKGYRVDKGPGEVDTIDTVRALYSG
jgi:DNA ligase 1